MNFFIGLIIGIIVGANASLVISAIFAINKDKKNVR